MWTLPPRPGTASRPASGQPVALLHELEDLHGLNDLDLDRGRWDAGAVDLLSQPCSSDTNSHSSTSTSGWSRTRAEFARRFYSDAKRSHPVLYRCNPRLGGELFNFRQSWTFLAWKSRKPCWALPLATPLPKTKLSDEAGLFGAFGGHINVTDGRYVYMRAPKERGNGPLSDTPSMPTHMRSRFGPENCRTSNWSNPFPSPEGLPGHEDQDPILLQLLHLWLPAF